MSSAVQTLSLPLDADWSSRCDHWRREATATASRTRRQRRKEPLILCGHGMSLRVDGGELAIRDGRTHYPQTPQTWRFWRSDPALPSRIILLDGSGSISLDVLDWLAEQGVALARLNWRGEARCVLVGNGYSADREKAVWQRAMRADAVRRLAFSIDLITRKIEAGVETLRTALPPSAARDVGILKLERELVELTTNTPPSVDVLRGVEGRASAAYFAALQGTRLNWVGQSRRPIPDEWLAVGPRTATRVGKIPKNDRATHPFNAMLNYGYAVIQARLQIEALSAGYDPTIGIMHHGLDGSAAYVFDLMEPERARVDGAILRFSRERSFSAADFTVRSDGACRMSPQLARAVVAACSKGAGDTPARMLPRGLAGLRSGLDGGARADTLFSALT